MKSYLRFLVRNKLYTAIELAGLGISLAFVILTSSYLIEKHSFDKDIKDKDEIYVCHNLGMARSFSCLSGSFDKHPEILDYCQFTEHTDLQFTINGNEFKYNVIGASANFFEFLPYKLVIGDAKSVLLQPHCAVVSESFAKLHFPEENPVGKIITHNSGAFTIQGVFKDVKKSIIINSDIIANMDFLKPEPGNYFDFANLLRISEGTNLQELAQSIYNGCDDFIFQLKLVNMLAFTKLSELDKNIGPNKPFNHLKDIKLQNTFILFCIVLLTFSVLNYVFLTVAFSRFRLKEMATRMLLGTTRRGIIKRITAESLSFTSFAFIAGILIASGLEETASEVLRSRIDLFSNTMEVVCGAGIIVLTSLLSGIIPALSSSYINPIEIIKGRSRRNDKVILGKLFIGVQCCICIVIISIAAAMFLQTKKMINSPLGYRTDNLLVLGGCQGKDIKNILGDLPSVKGVAAISSSPVQTSSGRTEMRFGNETLRVDFFNCDTTGLRIMGFEIVEKFSDAFSVFLTESLYKKALELCKKENILTDKIKASYAGVVKNFKFGNITSIYGNNNAIYVMPQEYAYKFVIETENLSKSTIDSITERLQSASITEYTLESFKDQIEESYRNEQNTIVIVSTFGLICILLTIMAIVAISSYYTQLKMHDTAVLKVFGISQRKLLWKTVWGFVLPVVVAVPFAVTAAYLFIENWLENYAVRIGNSLATYLATAAFIILIVLASVMIQAVNLMKTNPADTLKKE